MKHRAEKRQNRNSSRSGNTAELLREALILHQDGHPREALVIYQNILAIQPNNPEALNFSGVAAHQLGDLEHALAWLQRALSFRPEIADIHYNLGLVYKDLGRLKEALNAWSRCVQLAPSHAAAHNARGNVLQTLCRLEDAEVAYRRAVESDPRHANAHNNLGINCQRLGKSEEALSAFRVAVSLAPRDPFFWQNLAGILPEVPLHVIDQKFLRDLNACIARNDIDHVPLATVVVRVFSQQPNTAQLLSLKEETLVESEACLLDALNALRDSPLAGLLPRTPIRDYGIEKLLRAIRRALLRQGIRDRLTPMLDQQGLKFLFNLAQQCFLNEYVYFESGEESCELVELQARSGSTDDPSIALLAAYRPLHDLDFAHLLDGQSHDTTHPLFKKLIEQQLAEPMEELEIKKGIPQISPVTEGVSQSVREQYEQNPYPRWTSLEMPEPLSIASLMTDMFPHLQEQDVTWPEAPRILIVGCGTGKHPINTALRFANSDVLAIDLSLSSLAYAVRQAKAKGVTNIEFAQADLMSMGDIKEQFDVIECGGTLHHLADPIAGWRILVDLLKDDGFMGIGLYSEIARRRVVAAIEFIAENDYPHTLESIRGCRKDIMALPDANLARQVGSVPDFYTTSECRDLIFHVCEHRFSLPQISEVLDKLGLGFLGFSFKYDTVLEQYRARFPEDSTATSLLLWHNFELDNPNIFEGMYQFWTRKTKAA